MLRQVLGRLTYHVCLPQWGVTWNHHIDQLRTRVDPPLSTDHFGMASQMVPEANSNLSHCTESPPGAVMPGETSHDIDNYQGTQPPVVSTAESPVPENQLPVVSMEQPSTDSVTQSSSIQSRSPDNTTDRLPTT